jgi:hypothetical protein
VLRVTTTAQVIVMETATRILTSAKIVKQDSLVMIARKHATVDVIQMCATKTQVIVTAAVILTDGVQHATKNALLDV